MAYVYRIENLKNKKSYIGSTHNSISRRFINHRGPLNRNSHYNKHLQSSWNKYGENSFAFTILEECDSSNLISREQHYIGEYDTKDQRKGYNMKDARASGRKKTKIKKMTKRERSTFAAAVVMRQMGIYSTYLKAVER